LNLRRDHVGGGAFIVAGAVVLAVSGDLPFGTPASPGAGMLPTLVVGFMMAFGLLVLLHAGDSPPLAAIGWDDFPHALRLVLVAAAAVAAFTRVGFIATMAVMLFALTFAVERKPILRALAFSIGVTALAYALFSTLLKTPLPRGILGF
jgi:hypothetical protein